MTQFLKPKSHDFFPFEVYIFETLGEVCEKEESKKKEKEKNKSKRGDGNRKQNC